jgi:hypothetical protein
MLATLIALALAAPAAAAPDPADAPVLAVVQRFFDALAAQDAATMREIVLPGGVDTAVTPGPDGKTTMRRLPVDETFNSAIGPGLHERIWAPVVSLRGPIATVSAPYEFQRDGKTTHCGVDVFNLVKVDGAWKIASIMWTVEPDACAELKARR